jgi:hypothetical protein
MSAPDVIDGTATEVAADDAPAGRELVPAPPPTLAVTPQVKATELVERLNVIREAMTTAMQDGVDYGRVPGTDKPTLLKPGAEKLSVLFQLDVQLRNEKQWGPGDHLTVLSHATVFHAPTGARLGYGEGVCTTRERKYAKRRADRACPTCASSAIIKGKAEYGGGWVCFKKKGGCGAKFRDGDPAIEGQTVGEIENPDLPDLWNTVVKMAEKRARVDAVLAVTGASALFTQDVEDDQPATDAEPPPGGPNGAPAGRRDFERTGATDIPAGDPISPQRHQALSQRVGERLAAGLPPARLAAIFGLVGGRAERVNHAALGTLTDEQADRFERLLEGD